MLGLDCPTPSEFELHMTTRGLRKTLAHTPSPKLPVTPSMLRDLHSRLDLDNGRDLACWVGFLFLFFSFMRSSNLVPRSRPTFDPAKQLTIGDVTITTSGLVLRARWSKTIQFWERELEIPLAALPNSPLCPVRAYQRLRSLVPGGSSDPAISYSQNGAVHALTKPMLETKFKQIIGSLGYTESKFSLHSFRRGGCTWAYLAGVPKELLARHGDWRSDAITVYLALPTSYMFDVTRKMSIALDSL